MKNAKPFEDRLGRKKNLWQIMIKKKIKEDAN
jgi:hypothetical protein